jgi:Rrf2 family protein
MKITTKGRYALRFLLDLAMNQGEGYLSLKEIVERQNFSKKYIEQIIPILNRSDILLTTRGAKGGYRLAHSANYYTVAMILRLTEGGLSPITCLEQMPNPCIRCNECETLYVWKGLYKVVSDYLESITLQDIIDNKFKSINDYVI